jgi:hypothetical protein
MSEVILSLPSALAAELTEEDLVSEVIVWRGADVVSLIGLAADLTSAVTAVVATRQSLAAIARRLVHHVSTQAGDSADVSISVTVPHGTSVLVERNDQAGLTRLAVRVESAIQAALAEAECAPSGTGSGEATAV